MTRRLRRALTAVAACALLAVPVVPVRTDWIVFDPHNFAQNVLTAACELQQVNNEIQSLENQAQMLINQARDLASLPYSALKQLEQSIAQTQQLLAQAQNIAYSVTAINQAFTTTYPQSYPPKPGGSLSRSRIAGPALRTANTRRCSNRSTALRVRETPAASVSALPSPARSPAVSPAARRTAAVKRTDDGHPVHSFRTLLADLATVTRNTVRLGKDLCATLLATPTPLQQHVFDLIGISPAADL